MNRTRKKLALMSVFVLLMFSINIVSLAKANSTWDIQLIDKLAAGGSIELDSNDKPHIIYSNNGLQYATFENSNWINQTIDPQGSDGHLALDSNNNPHIFYKTKTYPSYSRYAFWTETNWTIHTMNSEGPTWIDDAMVLDPNGNPHIVYSHQRTLTNSHTIDLRYGVWTGSNWNIQIIDSVYPAYWYPSIALDSNSNPHITYHDHNNNVLKYATWSQNGNWSIKTIESTSNAQSSIAIDSKDYPHISYFSIQRETRPASNDSDTTSDHLIQTNNGLMYARWNGEIWDKQNIDPNTHLSGNSNLALDSKDKPHITYHLSGLFDSSLNYFDEIHALKYAKWTGTTWIIQTVDTNVVGAGHLTLDSQDKPHIAFSRTLGTVGGAPVYSHLTYATLIEDTNVESLYVWIMFFLIIVVIAVLSLHIYNKKSKSIRNKLFCKFT